MVRAITSLIFLACLFAQTLLAAHPFSAHCQNTGELLLTGKSSFIKTCCEAKVHQIESHKSQTQLKCCTGIRTDFQALTVERVREGHAEQKQDEAYPAKLFCSDLGLLKYSLEADSVPRPQNSPPDLQSYHRAKLGIWTC